MSSNENGGGKSSPPKEESQQQEYVTVTLGDGNTVEIPKREILFRNEDFSQDLEGVVVDHSQEAALNSPPERRMSPPTNGRTINGRRTSPPMPDVDVSSEIHTNNDDTTISTTSMMVTDTNPSQMMSETAGGPSSDTGGGLSERESRFGREYGTRWREGKDEWRARVKEHAPPFAEKWKGKVRDRRLGVMTAKKWRAYVEKCKEERKQVGITLLKKARERKKRAAEQPATEVTTETEKKEDNQEPAGEPPKEESKKEPSKEEQPAKPEEEVKNGKEALPPSTIQPSAAPVPEPEVPRKRSQELKAAIKKAQPKIAMVRRKDAPPILSLPGEPEKAKKQSQPPKKSEGPSSPSQPPPSGAAGPTGGAPPPPPPPGDEGGDGGKKPKKDDDKEKKEAEREEEPKPKTFKEGVPQEMAGRLMLACKRGDWLMADHLLKKSKTDGLDIRYVTEHLGWNPLHFAAKDNRVNLIDPLLEAGYSVNAKAKDGTTPLHLACIFAREDTIRILLLRGADPSIPGGVSILKWS